MKPFIPLIAVALFALPAAVTTSDAVKAAEPAQTQPTATPEEVIRRTLEAMRSRDFEELAKQAHSAGLAELRQKLRPLVEADSRHELSKLVFGVESLEAFDALNDQKLFVAMMTQLNSLGSDSSSDARFTVISSTAESSDLAHVVYRAHFTGDGGAPASTLNVMTVRKDRGEWKTDLTENINEMTGKIFALLQSAVRD